MDLKKCFTVDVLPVADVLEVASRLLPAQLRLLVVRLQPGVGISAEFGAGRHAARGRAPHLAPSVRQEGLEQQDQPFSHLEQDRGAIHEGSAAAAAAA